MSKLCVFVLFILFRIVHGAITITPGINSDDVNYSTTSINGESYTTVSIDGRVTENVSCELGLPLIPASYMKFVLPPGQEISNITLTNETWETLIVDHAIAPIQDLSAPDAEPVDPVDAVYNSATTFPESVISIVGQSSLSGFGVATICVAPVRYIPSESKIEILTSAEVSIEYSSSQFESVTPLRSSAFAAELRLAGIRASVVNTDDIDLYPYVPVTEHQGCEPLYITDEPSIYGDAVDYVIITVDEYVSDFEELAELRTEEGIITVIRTVDWINATYSGCDTPQRIRNFIKDAHSKWGIQFVLLGGEEEDVPDRLINKGDKSNIPYETYYGDIDGDWIELVRNGWEVPDNMLGYEVEVCIARLPVNSGSDDFDTFFTKLNEYENPTQTDEYLKQICSMTFFLLDSLGAIDYSWANQTKFIWGEWFMENSDWMIHNGGTVNQFTTLYCPEDFDFDGLPYAGVCELNRENALNVLEDSYSIFLHTDHSGTHNLGMGTSIPGPNKIFDADFYNMGNDGHPFIFYSSCCWPGHYNGAESILEHSLFASSTSGAVASVGAPVGNGAFAAVYYFLDAFYPFLYDYDSQTFSNHDPLSFIGEGWKHRMNTVSYMHFEILFGDPAMFVWRDMPDELVITGLPTSATAGTAFSTSISVTNCGIYDVEGATVVLCQDGELFATATTNSSGIASFTNLYSSTPGVVKVAAHKFNEPTGEICNYIIDRASFTIGASTSPILSIESLDVDDSSTSTFDGNFNPGETVYLDLAVRNTGGDETRNVTATLTASTSTLPGVTIIDNTAAISRILEEQTVTVDDAFEVALSADFVTSNHIEFTVTFTSPDGSWDSVVYMYAASGEIHIPVSDISIPYSTLSSLNISIDRMVLCNSGAGDAAGVTVTASNFDPAHTRVGGTRSAYFSSISALDGAEADGVIDFTLVNLRPGSDWLKPDMPGCSFDLVITDAAGNTYSTRVMNMEDWAYALAELTPLERCPYDLVVNEASSSTAEIEWSQLGLPNVPFGQGPNNPAYHIFGYMIYTNNSSSWDLVSYYPSPAPEWNFTDLEAMTEYEVRVTVVDSLGRESIMSGYSVEYLNFSTTCPQEIGWPQQLYGNIGSGPLLANVDGIPGDEIVAVTDCGNLYVGNSSSDFTDPVLSESSIWFTGCATADIRNDGNVDIIAAGMNDISNGEVNICLIERGDSGDWEITTTYWTGDGWKMHENTGVPMIFQADATEELEVAFRTYNGWYPGHATQLQILKIDDTTGYLETYDTGYPVPIGDGDNTLVYTPPVLLDDFDNDGNVEVALTCHRSSGGNNSIPAIAVVDIASAPVVEYFDIPLPTDPDLTDDEVWKIRSTLAAVKYGTTTYVTGLLSYHYDEQSLDDRQLFILNVTNGTFVTVSDGLVEDVTMFDWSDHFSGGPCIGYVNSNTKPDILVAMDGLYAWDLDGSTISMGASAPELVEDMDVYTGGSLSAPSLVSVVGVGNVAFTGYSSRTYGHSMSDGFVLTGFPHYTEDKVYTTPIAFDFDGDGNIEVLNGNKSGLLSMLDWDEELGTGLTWPMFQHDPQRTGYWNHVARGNGLDICVSDVFSLETAGISSSGTTVEVTIEVTGAETVATETNHAVIQHGSSAAEQSAPVNQTRSSSSLINDGRRSSEISELLIPADNTATASVAIVDANSKVLFIKEFPLVNGTHRVRLTVPSGVSSYSVIADPFNEYVERSESNNASEAVCFVGSTCGVNITSLANPSFSSINLGLLLGNDVSGEVSISVYSLAGRVVSRSVLRDVAPGSYQLELRGENDEPLAAGAYLVRIETEGFDESRQVIVLNK